MNIPADPLAQLRDIHLPDGVAWWPPAPGWYVVLELALLAALIYAIRWAVRYRRAAYRRDALARLQSLPKDKTGCAALADLLKRTALATYPRQQVAHLSGTAWLSWLADTGGQTVPEVVGATLTQSLYDDSEPVAIDALFDFAARWIRQHEAAPPC